MPKKKTFSLVTIVRTSAQEDSIRSVDVQEGLTIEELSARLSAPSPTMIGEVQRHVFRGDAVPWAPSVRLGEPRKRKSAENTPKTRKPREEKPANGTKFDESGAKAAGEGQAHGA